MQHQQLFKQLFNHQSSPAKAATLLESTVEQYPYFTAAQFYLLQQTAKDNSAYKQRAGITSLLFNDPLWLNYQLKEKTGETLFPPTEENIIVDELPIMITGPVSSMDEEVDNVSIETNEQKREAENDAVEAEINNTDEVMDQEKDEATPWKQTVPNFKLTMPNESKNNKEMLFEPMHLVDYFASQGIKLTDEIKTTDKLGKQLKSFTEWLKVMKKVNEDLPLDAPISNEAAIQIMAEKSNTEAEVITESMAEVFIMQGRKKKAMDIYKKLSLSDTAKSAYFAAKIDSLKG